VLNAFREAVMARTDEGFMKALATMRTLRVPIETLETIRRGLGQFRSRLGGGFHCCWFSQPLDTYNYLFELINAVDLDTPFRIRVREGDRDVDKWHIWIRPPVPGANQLLLDSVRRITSASEVIRIGVDGDNSSGLTDEWQPLDRAVFGVVKAISRRLYR
jgi:hypothetical protein